MDAFAAALATTLETKPTVGPRADEQFSLDFQPYLKTSDRQFHISDWTTKQRGRAQNSSHAGGFAFKADEFDGASFVAERGGQQRSRNFLKPGSQRTTQTGPRGAAGKKQIRQPNTTRRNDNTGRRPFQNQRNNNRNYFRREEIQRGYSCTIAPTWENIYRFPLTTPSGTSLPRVTTLQQVGQVDVFNNEYRLVNTKTAKPVQVNEQFSTAQIALEKDPYIQSILANENNHGDEMTFVMTDQVASLLMNVHHTIQPWDLNVKINDKNIAFVTTTSPNNIINQQLIDEAQSDRLPQEPEHINSIQSLAPEATATANNIRYLFTRRGAEPHVFNANFPAVDDQPNLNTAYTYRRFVLDDIAVIVRAPLHCHQPSKPDSLSYIATLFEYDSTYSNYHVDFRKNVDTQFGSVFSNELKTNTAYMHRILCQALLSDAEEIKLAWVSRVNFKQPGKHTLLNVTSHPIQQFLALLQSRKVDYFAQMSNVLSELILDAGEYTLLREPNERTLSIFDCNGNAAEKAE